MQDALDQDVIDFAGRKANAQPATTAADDEPLSDDEIAARAGAAHELLPSYVPERAADPAKQSSRHLRPRTAEEIANEQTAEQLALRTWAAMVAQKVLSGMSALMDELIQSHLLDDDDEEADEGWLDDHHNRENKILDEAITDGLDKYPDFNAINNLPPNSDPDVARDAEQLKDVLTKCAIGATKFKGKFSRAQLERMVKRDLKTRFEKDPRYSEHLREDVPGSDVRKYGSRGRTSSKGTFAKAVDYREWRRVGSAVHRRVDACRQGSHRSHGLVASVWLSSGKLSDRTGGITS